MPASSYHGYKARPELIPITRARVDRSKPADYIRQLNGTSPAPDVLASAALPFTGITTDGRVVPGLYPLQDSTLDHGGFDPAPAVEAGPRLGMGSPNDELQRPHLGAAAGHQASAIAPGRVASDGRHRLVVTEALVTAELVAGSLTESGPGMYRAGAEWRGAILAPGPHMALPPFSLPRSSSVACRRCRRPRPAAGRAAGPLP